MGLLVLFAAGFVLFWGFLVWHTLRSLLYPARRTFAWCVARGQPSDPGATNPPRPFEDASVWRYTWNGGRRTCPIWSIKGQAPDGPVVVFTHGWSESKQSVLARLDAIAPVASRIFAWDLPGHGESSPGGSSLGLDEPEWMFEVIAFALGWTMSMGPFSGDPYVDVNPVTAHDWVQFPPDPGAKKLILYGFSLGAGTSIEAACRLHPDRLAGVIAEAPYRLAHTPARNVLRLMGLPHRLNLRPALFLAGLRSLNPFWSGFDRAKFAARVPCPVLVIHGSDDEVCPIDDGRAIAASAPRGTLLELAGETHLSIWTEGDSRTRAMEAVRSFASQNARPRIADGRPTREGPLK